MAADDDDKTEEPTPRKLEQAREKISRALGPSASVAIVTRKDAGKDDKGAKTKKPGAY